MRNAVITLHEINDEALAMDTDLAERLGMAVPRRIRQNIIEPNRDELEGYGPLVCHSDKSRGQVYTAFYLNEEQALLICMLSRALELMGRCLRQAFIDLYTMHDPLEAFRVDIFSHLSEENGKLLPAVPPKGDLDLTRVAESDFFFA